VETIAIERIKRLYSRRVNSFRCAEKWNESWVLRTALAKLKHTLWRRTNREKPGWLWLHEPII